MEVGKRRGYGVARLEERAGHGQREAKIATKTMNGMYVTNDRPAMTRHRVRHDLASVRAVSRDAELL